MALCEILNMPLIAVQIYVIFSWYFQNCSAIIRNLINVDSQTVGILETQVPNSEIF